MTTDPPEVSRGIRRNLPAPRTWCFPGGGSSGNLARMSGVETAVLFGMLALCAGCLIVLLGIVLRMAGRLRRVEKLLASREAGNGTVVIAASAGTSAPRGEFETFLTEDPARRQLSKGEQFSAYRKWRREKGLNWSK